MFDLGAMAAKESRAVVVSIDHANGVLGFYTKLIFFRVTYFHT